MRQFYDSRAGLSHGALWDYYRAPRDNPKVNALLNETEIGREKLAWAKAHGVEIVYYRPSGSDELAGVAHGKTIHIRPGLADEIKAAVLVHEITHLQNETPQAIQFLIHST